MNLSSFPEYIAEALCWANALRNLGFSSDDIYVGTQGEVFFVVLRVPGAPEFVIGAGPTKLSQEENGRLWLTAATAYNAGTFKAELEAFWPRSEARQQAVQLCAGLTMKGIPMPIAEKKAGA